MAYLLATSTSKHMAPRKLDKRRRPHNCLVRGSSLLLVLAESDMKCDGTKRDCQLYSDKCKAVLTYLASGLWVLVLPGNDLKVIGLGDQPLDAM
jgi:hypothetical protein